MIDNLDQGWEKAFLAALANSGNVRTSCQLSGIGKSQVYRRRESDPVFAKACDTALEDALEVLEEEARRRAMKSSDLLLIFMLKAIAPQKYRESRVSIPPAELNKLIEAELRKLREAEEVTTRVN